MVEGKAAQNVAIRVLADASSTYKRCPNDEKPCLAAVDLNYCIGML